MDKWKESLRLRAERAFVIIRGEEFLTPSLRQVICGLEILFRTVGGREFVTPVNMEIDVLPVGVKEMKIAFS